MSEDATGGDTRTVTDGGEETGTATVLVVDDEEPVTEAYALWLDDTYVVRTATGGEEALSKLDDDVDVVLLDRRMPGLTGDEVLERIREEGYDCRVAMVTAVDPDFDVTEMPFDGYLNKPVTGDKLKETVERMLALATYESDVQELFSLAERRAVLEERKSERQLEGSEEYTDLTTELERKREEAGDVEMDHDTFASALSDLPGDE